MDDNFRLQPRTRQWIKAIRAHYQARPLTAPAPVEALEHSFKIM